MLRPYMFSPPPLHLPKKPNPEPLLRSGLARSGQVAVDTCAATYFLLRPECRRIVLGEGRRGVCAVSGNRPVDFVDCCPFSVQEGFFIP